MTKRGAYAISARQIFGSAVTAFVAASFHDP
jgi:hypothetical protein